MKMDKFLLLDEELTRMARSMDHLNVSMGRCASLLQKFDWTTEELERLESLASRFARLADILIQRVMRLIDELELVGPGTVLDRIVRAEQRGWVAQAQRLVEIRELRNLIAHEYAAERMAEIYTAICSLAPELMAIARRVQNDSASLKNKYSKIAG